MADSPSVLKGLLTAEGLANCIRMASNGGWHIYPTKFCISDVIGEIAITRTTLDRFDTWYEAPISGRIVQSAETIEFLCTIPPGVAADLMYIREIYLMAETTDGTEFMLGLCGIDGVASYDPSGSTKLRILINIQNLNLTDLFVFKYTQAQELEDHNNDPNAHPDLSALVTGVGKPTVVFNNYVASEGQTLFVDSSGGPVVIQLPRTGLRQGSRVEVVDVGWKCDTKGKEISVVSVDHKIDKRTAQFVINQKGASVRFLYWPNHKSWCVDVGGRFYADLEHAYDETKTTLLYTEYIGKNGTVIINNPGETTAKVGDVIFIKTGDPSVTEANPPVYGLNLPAAPAAGDRVTFIDCNGNFKKNPPKVNGNGHTIQNSANYFTMDKPYGLYSFYYDSITEDWKVTVQSTRATTAGGLQGERLNQTFWTVVPAQTVLTVPEYTVGASFAVWLDGILCTKSDTNDSTGQYAEIGVAGEPSTKFMFWDAIPAGMTITTLS